MKAYLRLRQVLPRVVLQGKILKNYCIVSGSVPNPHSGGGTIVPYGVIKGLLSMGITPSVCAIVSRLHGFNNEKHAGELEKLGVRVGLIYLEDCGLEKAYERFGFLKVPVVEALAREKVSRYLDSISADVLFLYHYQGLFALDELSKRPYYALLGDPFHLVRWYGWWYSLGEIGWKASLKELARSCFYTNAVNFRLRRPLQLAFGLGATAHHHAQWYASFSGKDCKYYRCPVEDTSGSNWKKNRSPQGSSGKFKIIHVGNTSGTTNRPGLQDFEKVIYPFLKEKLPKDSFEVHFIGHSKNIEPALKRLAEKESAIFLRGRVESIDKEFLTADMMLVANGIRLGNRTRIASGWSFGCPTVSHSANSWGMPDLKNEENILLGENPVEIAEQTIRLFGDRALAERIGAAGRKTFEDYFDINVSGKMIARDFLEKSSK